MVKRNLIVILLMMQPFVLFGSEIKVQVPLIKISRAQKRAGQTELMIAAKNGDKDTVIKLIKGGADVFKKNKMGRSARELAEIEYAKQELPPEMRSKYQSIISRLKSAEQAIQNAEKAELTEIMLAAKNADVGKVFDLVKKGVDVLAKNKGLTARGIAERELKMINRASELSDMYEAIIHVLIDAERTQISRERLNLVEKKVGSELAKKPFGKKDQQVIQQPVPKKIPAPQEEIKERGEPSKQPIQQLAQPKQVAANQEQANEYINWLLKKIELLERKVKQLEGKKSVVFVGQISFECPHSIDRMKLSR